MRVVSLYVGLFFLFFSSFFCFRVNWIGGLGSFLYFSPSETATRLLLMPAMVECNCIASVEGFSFMCPSVMLSKSRHTNYVHAFY